MARFLHYAMPGIASVEMMWVEIVMLAYGLVVMMRYIVFLSEVSMNIILPYGQVDIRRRKAVE